MISPSLLKYNVTRFVSASSQRVDMGAVYGFERTDSWSVACWLRTTQASGMLMGKQATSGNFLGWGLFTISAAIFWRIGFGGLNLSAAVSSAVPTLQDGNWHHIVATYDGSSDVSGMVVYHNGDVATNTTLDNDLAGSILNAAPFQIGARNSTDSFFSGDMQDASVWTGVLTAANALAMYNKGCPPDVLDLGIGTPLSYWILGEHKGDVGGVAAGITSGTNVPDLGSNNFDGTMVNGPTVITRL